MDVLIFGLMCIIFGYVLGVDRTERKHLKWLEKHYQDLNDFWTPKK